MSSSQAEQEAILLVDHDAELLAELRRTAEAEGWRAVIAATAADALSEARRTGPGVAVVEQALPDGDGADVVRELRRQCPGILCVLVASQASLETAMGALESRAYAYLARPHPMGQLVALIRSAVDVRALRRQYEQEIIRAAQLQTVVRASRVMQDRINNPLQTILGNAELLQMLAPSLPERAQQLVAGIVKGCDRVGTAVNQLAQAIEDHVTGTTRGPVPDLDVVRRMLAALDDEGRGGLPGPDQPPPPRERRASPRYACGNLMLSVPVDGKETWHVVRNISLGGVGVTLLADGDVPAHFRGRLWDLDAHDSVPVDVAVRWCHQDTQCSIGLCFTSHDAQFREWLEGVVARAAEREVAAARDRDDGSA